MYEGRRSMAGLAEHFRAHAAWRSTRSMVGTVWTPLSLAPTLTPGLCRLESVKVQTAPRRALTERHQGGRTQTK